MDDALIIAGTALIGALIMDIQRRASPRLPVIAGLVCLMLVWGAMRGGILPTALDGPSALCLAGLLLALALLLSSIPRLLRKRR